MPDIQYLPISQSDPALLLPLMDEEEKAWMADLAWDYSPIRQILISFVNQKLLPGYVAIIEKKAAAYTYFLVNQAKGIIGAIYASKTSCPQEAIEELLTRTVSSLKDSQSIERVEAQTILFHNLALTDSFTRHGFYFYPRYFLELDLILGRKRVEAPLLGKIIPWDSSYISRAAEMTCLSYRDQIDAIICQDYRTKAGCESYLRSLVEHPGCGVFMPEASFMGLDGHGHVCGFVISCRISEMAGMIPQIAVHPSYQGQGIGNALMAGSFERFKSMGIPSLSLTVTAKNRRAFEWYQRLGFRIRKEFGAYVWQR